MGLEVAVQGGMGQGTGYGYFSLGAGRDFADLLLERGLGT